MPNHAVTIESAIEYIESHLDGKLDLERVADAVHYSKYHLHRMFAETVGITIHDYVQRRQLTEAAKRLVFSKKPILDIAFLCGYESQQAFTSSFRAMYKLPPAEYRDNRSFYPLQLRFTLHQIPLAKSFTKEDITFADPNDIPDWMNLMRLVIDGYPVMNETDYLNAITRSIEEKHALILRHDQLLIGAMTFSAHTGSIEFWGVHPQYRRQGVEKLFLDVLLDVLPGKAISMTTYREGDHADPGYRDTLKRLGFVQRELLIEFGYPTQRFVLDPNGRKGETR